MSAPRRTAATCEEAFGLGPARGAAVEVRDQVRLLVGRQLRHQPAGQGLLPAVAGERVLNHLASPAPRGAAHGAQAVVHAALHGAGRDAEVVGDLVVRPAPPVDLHQHPPMVVVELGQGRLHLPGGEGAIELVVGGAVGRRPAGRQRGRARRARAKSITTLRRMANSQVRWDARAGS